MTNVELHIERLILDGISLGADGERRLQTALQARLTDLFGERQTGSDLLTGGSVARVQAAPFSVGAGADPTAFGSGLADAVYHSLHGGSAR